MHDMPRVITYSTSGVLRLLVVHHRWCVCVRTKSVMIARTSDIFQRKQQYHPPYNRHITQSRRKVKSLWKNVPAGIPARFLHMFAKAKEDLPENLSLSCPSPLPTELDLSWEPHSSNELVDVPEDLPLSGEEQGDIDAKPAPMPLKRHEELLEGAHGEAPVLGAKLEVDGRTCS